MSKPIKTWLLRIAVVALVGVAAAVAWRFLQPRGLPDGFAGGNGRIEAVEIDIAAKTAGRVKDILANEGDFVRAGQELARMDTAVLEAQLREAEAQLRRALIGIETAQSQVTQREAEKQAAEALVAQRKAELDAAQRRVARSEELAPKGAVSVSKLDDDRAAFQAAKAAVGAAEAQAAAAQAAIGRAKSDVIAAEATVEAARATIQRIQADIDDSVLRSPRDGRVQYRVAQPGEVLSPGGVVLNMVDLSDVYMTFFLPTEQAGRVALGTEARLVLDAAPQYVIPAASLLRRGCRAVHAQDGGDGRRTPEADVPHQGADRPGPAQEAPPPGQDRPAGHGLCAARPAGGLARRTADQAAAMSRDPSEPDRG